MTAPMRHFGVPVLAILAGCSVQLVAPYDPELLQRASTMQAEVAAWELGMRAGAGTVRDDPRNPEVAEQLNKWRGQADAMLTLAVSNQPAGVNCGPVADTVSAAIQSSLPADLRGGTKTAAAGSSGCEARLVANVGTQLDAVEKALSFCREGWIPDSYFAALALNRGAAPKPPAAPDRTGEGTLTRSCLAEFKAPGPSAAPTAAHGRAVSPLLLALQSIVYVENRKKAAASK